MNLCTTDDVCQQGSCRGGPPLPCEPCGTCDPVAGCITTLAFECLAPTATRQAVVELEEHRRSPRNTLTWEWRSGGATTKDDFGDPLTTTGYALCFFGDVSVPLLRAAAPANADCSRRSACWHATARGFRYHVRSGSPDGLSSISLRAGGPGRARIIVKGMGRKLDLPPLPLAVPITVQLRRTDGSGPCWSAVHDFVVRNRADRFVAEGN
jgi:hypothetical protein